MGELNIVCDGSYKPGVIGLGWLKYTTDGEIADVKSVRLQSKSLRTKHGGQIAELLAAIFAIKAQSAESNIQLWTDNEFVADCFNKGSLTLSDTEEIREYFDQTLAMYHSMDVRLRSEDSVIPRHAFAVAHNASAVASGAAKRECTLPYTDEFWSPETIISRYYTWCETTERLRRYGFA